MYVSVGTCGQLVLTVGGIGLHVGRCRHMWAIGAHCVGELPTCTAAFLEPAVEGNH